MNEQQIRSGNFLFVSYCHNDNEPTDESDGLGVIKHDIFSLQAQGARLWFDENLFLSDNWRMRVKAILSDPHCVGAIFYNSPQAFIKEAMAYERELIAEKAKQNAAFKYYCVQPNFASTADLLKEATAMANIEYDKYESFFDSYRSQIKEMFNDDIIMIRETDPVVRTKSLLEKVIIPNGVIDNESNIMRGLKQQGMLSKDTDALRFGIFTDRKSDVDIAASETYCRKNQYGRTLIAFDGILYETKELTWTLLFVKENQAFFICDDIISKHDGCTANKFLTDIFLPLAFSDEERKLIGSIGLLKLEDYNQLIQAGAVFPRVDSYWWINGQGKRKGWQMAVKNCKINERGFICTLAKGIRPVITIATNKINEIGTRKENH